MPRRMRQPRRTCIGCRQAADKRTLLRVVRTPDGDIELDPTGKRSGRGAYVCPDQQCLDAAFSSQRLETALRQAIAPGIRERLKEDLARCMNQTSP